MRGSRNQTCCDGAGPVVDFFGIEDIKNGILVTEDTFQRVSVECQRGGGGRPATLG